MFPTTMVHGTS